MNLSPVPVWAELCPVQPQIVSLSCFLSVLTLQNGEIDVFKEENIEFQRFKTFPRLRGTWARTRFWHLDIKPKQVWCSGCGGGDSLALDKSKKEHKYNSKAGAELILNPISQHIFECLSRLNRCLEVHQNSWHFLSIRWLEILKSEKNLGGTPRPPKVGWRPKITPSWLPITCILYCKFLFYYQHEEVNKKPNLNIFKIDRSIAILSSNFIFELFSKHSSRRRKIALTLR